MKDLLTISFILVFCAMASAQQSSLLDEVRALERFRSEQLRDLKFFVSTEDDIARLMGKRCLSVCDHNATWRVYFSRVASWGMLKDGNHYKPRAEFMRKLAGIKFFPKTRFKIESMNDLPPGLTCRTSAGVHELPSIRNQVCTDSVKRISFYIPSESTPDGMYIEGHLAWVHFGPDAFDHDKIWELIPK